MPGRPDLPAKAHAAGHPHERAELAVARAERGVRKPGTEGVRPLPEITRGLGMKADVRSDLDPRGDVDQIARVRAARVEQPAVGVEALVEAKRRLRVKPVREAEGRCVAL